MHDLVRLHARERAAAEDGDADRAAALCRLVDRYRWLAHEVTRELLPARQLHLVTVPEPRAAWTGGPAPGLADLDAERHQLRDVAALAGRCGGPDALWSLVFLLAGYFQMRGDGLDSLELYRAALAAAEELGDEPRAVAMHNSLGIAHAVCGQWGAAATHLDRSVALSRARGDAMAEAVSLFNLARVLGELGEPDRARAALLRSLRLREELGRTERSGHVLNGLGWLELKAGDHAAAERRLAAALELHRANGDLSGVGHTLDTIGQVHAARGETAAAAEKLLAALEVLRSVGDVPGEVETLRNLGRLELAGDPRRAVPWLAEAVGKLRAAGDLHQQAIVHRELAEAYLALGERSAAGAELRAALELRRTLPDPAEERRIRELLDG
jgi:tetratricopeptide (TPR) repeat protein